ncbi:MAG: beta-N-acetylhexosaminidase [Candidatus Azotimanducaceae bacterium]|nr:glycoside hydrolase [Gammaproteobacteria bacterium]OUV68819.1 MAG: hypothetical protein CBC93_00365 [Gammaproteobacteria bacterium TMED133]
MNIYPPPKAFRLHDCWTATDSRLVHVSYSISPRLRRAINSFCQKHHLELAEKIQGRNVLVTINRVNASPQSYSLKNTNKGITLEAANDDGIFYGLATLDQFITYSGSRLQCFTIQDQPDFECRAVMLDISRCKVPKMNTLFMIIDNLAALKINQLQLYVEHTFAFKQHRTVWKNSSPLTAGQLSEIRDYCYDRFIELVPNLNSFGHFERWLRHPEYRKYAECPDGFVHPLTDKRVPFGSTLKPNQKSLKLIAGLYDEYLPIFDSQYFNVGGDEPWELGHGWSAKQCEQKGTAQVYVSFMHKIKHMVEKYGKQTMFWADIVLKYPESIKILSEDLTALVWGYEADHPFEQECKQIASRDLSFYVCPGTSSWNSITGRQTNATKNLNSAAVNGFKYGAKGYLITDWGDHGHHQYLPISFGGLTSGACHAWNHKAARCITLPDAIHRIWLPEQEKLSTLLVQLGEIPDGIDVGLRNASIFNHLLFWDMRKETIFSKKLTEEQLGVLQQQLWELFEEIDVMPTTLVSNELSNALCMAIHSLDRLALFRGYGNHARDPKKTMRDIIARHRILWKMRNRLGGLAESNSFLYQSEKCL